MGVGNGLESRENKEAIDAWCAEKNLSYTEPVRAYMAANLELEKAMDYLVKILEAKGIADDTVICIALDHFPYGLDSDAALGNMPYLSELYGYPVNNYEERDRSRAIIWCGMGFQALCGKGCALRCSPDCFLWKL